MFSYAAEVAKEHMFFQIEQPHLVFKGHTYHMFLYKIWENIK